SSSLSRGISQGVSSYSSSSSGHCCPWVRCNVLHENAVVPPVAAFQAATATTSRMTALLLLRFLRSLLLLCLLFLLQQAIPPAIAAPAIQWRVPSACVSCKSAVVHPVSAYPVATATISEHLTARRLSLS